MKKFTILLIMVTMFNKLFGIGRELVLSFFYGVSVYSDAFIVSTSIPNIIVSFIAAGIATTFIPVYSRVKSRDGEDSANKFMSNLLTVLIMLTIVLVVFGQLFTGEIVKLLASGFEGERFEIAVQFTRITLFGSVFTIIMAILNGYLQIKDKFLIPALSFVVFNITVIFSIVFSNFYDPIFMVIGQVVAVTLQCLFIYIFVKKTNYSYKATFNLSDENLRMVVMMAIPVIIGTSISQINAIIDKTLASQIVDGGISILSYASKINASVSDILVTTVATVLFPTLARYGSEENFKALMNTFKRAINSINILIIPATIGVVVFATPLVGLFYGRGQFGPEEIRLTAGPLMFYAMGMAFSANKVIAARVFYSLQDTRTPVINAGLTVVIKIGLNLILAKNMGLNGLALATTIAELVTMVLLLYSLSKRVGKVDFSDMLFSSVKILTISIIMGVVSWSGYNLFVGYELNMNLSLIFSVILGIFVYGLLLLFIRIDEVELIKKSLLKKIGIKAE